MPPPAYVLMYIIDVDDGVMPWQPWCLGVIVVTFAPGLTNVGP